jgi:ATP-dependent exoDNAse (exonuclease V) alpha subunit
MLAVSGRGAGAARAQRAIVQRALMRPGLADEQRALIRGASLRPDRVICVVGVAGAGKTTALRVLADAYRESAVPVLGAAPSGRAADELANASGIRSSTLHRLVIDAQREGGLPHGCLLIVDEASMAETRVLAPALELVGRARGKAILVGDPHQLAAVGAGGLYAALCERLGAIHLTENRRQRDLSERQALARLRGGEPEPFLAHAARRGRLQLADDPMVVKQRLLDDWWQAARHDLRGTVMLAYRRADVRDLNDAARTLLIRAGRLGPVAREFGDREFRLGDRVLCRHNESRLGVRNGTRGTVVGLSGSAVTFRTDAGAIRSVGFAYAADHLEHGYALTGHAAQGATVERAYVLLHDRGALREWGYVARTRARTETRLYLAATGWEHETHAPDRDPLGVSDRTARALARSSLEPLAHAHTADDSLAQLGVDQRRRLERDRARAQERLSAAQQRLERFGRSGRRRKGAELRAEIAFYRTALRLADEELKDLKPRPRRTLQPPRPRHDHELARTRSRRLEREPPGLGVER